MLLLRLSLARGVYSLIKDAPADWTLRIGVYGAWGEGKTTLLNLLANLAQKDGLPVARFSPSLSRDNTQLWNSFFLAVTGALGAPARPISASARARWHWQRLRAWLGKQRWFSGFLKAAEPSHPIAGPLFRLAEMATDEFRARIGMSSERVSALLSTHLANRRLLVLIDDIDRTEPALLPGLLLAVRELDVPLTEAQEPAIALEREIPRARRFEHEDDEQKLLDASDVHLRGVLVALLDTACRVGEVLSLQWKDVNLDRKEIVIEAVKAKTRTARIVPISTRLKGVLEMRRLDPAGKEFGPDAYVFGDEVGERVGSVRIAWEAARDAAGLSGLQLRDLRHEAGSRFDEAGVPTNYVSKLLGHTNLTTTSRYLNIHRRGLQLAMQKLEEHRAGQKSVAQGLHKDQENAPAVAPASDDHPVSKQLPS